MIAFYFFHRRDAEGAKIIFSWSDFLRGKIRPNNLPAAANHKKRRLLKELYITVTGINIFGNKTLPVGLSASGRLVFHPLNGKLKDIFLCELCASAVILNLNGAANFFQVLAEGIGWILAAFF
jgi:hypothetical protein